MQSKLGQRDLKRPRRAARSAYGPAALLARAMNRAAYQSTLPDGILVTPPARLSVPLAASALLLM